jgi:predicted nucleic acid-binding protein
MTIKVTTDTSVLISGLVPPRRRIKDQLFSEQHDLYMRANEIMGKILKSCSARNHDRGRICRVQAHK